MGKNFSQNLILSASSDLQKIRSLLVVITMSVVLALLGKFSIILPFSPIPFVIQAHVCLFLGLCLPRHQAVGAVALFLIQGLCGLPVFALGQGGFSVLLGPRGGYLLGYIVGTWVTSYVYQKIQTQEYIKRCLALVAGTWSIYFCGAYHLATFIGFAPAFWLGIFPFIIADNLKILFFSWLYPRFKRPLTGI